MKKQISQVFYHLKNDSLYRNSIFLMLSTGVMAFLGFFFWLINARLFTTEQVGIGTTLISVMTLISSFSLLGLGDSLIKYLPTSERKNEKINTSFMLVGLTSILISIIFLVFLKAFSPKLLFIRESIFFTMLFILFIIFSSLNSISENIFVAYRSSEYVLIKNTVLSIAKLILPFIFVALGAYGIFTSVGIALTIALAFGLIFLTLKFNYLFKPIINMDIVKRMTRFSLGNYASGFIGGLPSMVLPILITNSIGAKFSAYFYMDMMIANLLYIIPLAVSQSLFAEGSYNELELREHLKKTMKIISFTLVPAILITMFFGKYILLAFGKQYSIEGVRLLQILAISGIFVSISYVGGTLLKIRHQMKKLITINLVSTVIVLGLSYCLVSKGLIGIGTAYIVGNTLISGVYILIWHKN